MCAVRSSFGFDSNHDARLLVACGYVCEHIPASWQDIGGPESGPCVVGGPAYCVWTHPDGHEIIVAEGEVQEWGDCLEGPDELPF